jgi:hypothetical protein
MMRRKRVVRISEFALLLTVLLFTQTSEAGELTYTVWEDEQDTLWVRIQNGTAKKIRVEEIQVLFYDKKGKPVEERGFPCSGDCLLIQEDARDFKLEKRPETCEDYRVRNVRFKSE